MRAHEAKVMMAKGSQSLLVVGCEDGWVVMYRRSHTEKLDWSLSVGILY